MNRPFLFTVFAVFSALSFLCGPVPALAYQCRQVLGAESARTPIFIGGTQPAVWTPYIDGKVVWRGKVVTIQRHKYRVLDWDATRGSRTITLQSERYGTVRKVDPSTVTDVKIVIKAVRLKDLLAYKNERVINRYVRDHGGTYAESERVFGELMKWFFLDHRYTVEGHWKNKGEDAFSLGMFDEIQKLDDMWHEFILFTSDYAEFGKTYLGYFEDHNPFDMDPPKTPEQLERDRAGMYRFIKATLGPELLRSWYQRQDFADPNHPIRDHVSPDAVLDEP